MYRVTASFDSVDLADLASGRLRSSVPEIGSIHIRRNPRDTQAYGAIDTDNATVAYADSTLSPATIYQAGMWSVMINGMRGSDSQPETNLGRGCTMIALGSRFAAERAAAVLRGIGARSVSISENPEGH